MKALDIALKNLKLIIRDKKVVLMIILIPIFYYSLMGLVFRDSGGIDISQYTVGYIDADLDSEISPLNEYQTISSLVETIQNTSNIEDQTSLFALRNLTLTDSEGKFDYVNSINRANDALVSEGIVAYVIFEEGFQSAINNANEHKIGIYENDTSSNTALNPLFKRTFIHTLLNNMNYETLNLTTAQYQDSILDFETYELDYILVINSDYEIEIESGNPALKLISNNFANTYNVDMTYNIIEQSLNEAIQSAGGAEVLITKEQVQNPTAPIKPSYTLYFLSSTSPTTISIVNQTFNSLISGIFNFNPNAIDFNVQSSQTQGKAISTLTYSSPGYLLYGVLNIMSFAMILITTEIKDGLFKRLLSSRMKISDLLWGNIIANTILVFIQVVIGLIILSLWGMSPYYLNLGTLILGIIINTIAISLFINALALSLVPVFKTPDAAAGGVWLFLIPLMAFSGVFFPIEFMSPTIANAVKWVPTRMAVIAYNTIMVNGQALTSINFWGNVLGELIFAGFLFILGIFMFHRFTRSANIKHNGTHKDKSSQKEVK